MVHRDVHLRRGVYGVMVKYGMKMWDLCARSRVGVYVWVPGRKLVV